MGFALRLMANLTDGQATGTAQDRLFALHRADRDGAS